MREVRLHQKLLVIHPAARLWYVLRAYDEHGTGMVTVGFPELSQLKESKPTIYRWLKQGQQLGFFRRYNWKNGMLSVWLGGLFAVCLKNEIKNWGAVTSRPVEELFEPNAPKIIASALATQDLQSRSRYAATQSLNKQERKRYKLPTIDDIFTLAKDTSPKLRRGVKPLPGVMRITDDRILADQTFIPFGASQERISESLGCHPSTLRRHLGRMGVKALQICQTKPEYKEIALAIGNEAYSWQCGDISYSEASEESVVLFERNGSSSAYKKGGHVVAKERFYADESENFFIYRCNLYDLNYRLESMKVARKKFKKLFSRAE